MKKLSHVPKIGGFSMVEMLTVIAVIGVISAIAIPVTSAHQVKMKEVRAKRNAQNIAHIYTAAQMAGLEFYSSDLGNDLEALIRKIAAGDTVSDGVFEGTFFGFNLMSEADLDETVPYLEYDLASRELVFDAND